MRPDIKKLRSLRGKYKSRSIGTNKGKGKAYNDQFEYEPNRLKYQDPPDWRRRIYRTPLYRMLKSSVGRDWNSIFSEIMEVIRTTDIQYHEIIRDIEYYVEMPDCNGQYENLAFNYRNDDILYVDLDGILRSIKNKRPDHRNRRKNNNKIRRNIYTSKYALKGTRNCLWFDHDFSTGPWVEPTYYSGVKETSKYYINDNQSFELDGNGMVYEIALIKSSFKELPYIHRIRQISRKEMDSIQDIMWMFR